jgi:hypothetical protein
MLRRSFVALYTVVGLVSGTALFGCGGPMWQVVVQSAPDPFVGARRFGVLPIDYSGLMVGRKPEPVYLAEKEPAQQASFQEDKAALNEKFLERLRAKGLSGNVEIVPATGPADAPFMIKASVRFLEPGFYVGVAAAPSEVHMNVKILAPDGRVLDEIELAHGTDPRSGVAIGGFEIPGNPSSGGRLRKDGEALGTFVGEYVLARVVGR